jgi:hypothetical protein
VVTATTWRSSPSPIVWAGCQRGARTRSRSGWCSRESSNDPRSRVSASCSPGAVASQKGPPSSEIVDSASRRSARQEPIWASTCCRATARRRLSLRCSGAKRVPGRATCQWWTRPRASRMFAGRGHQRNRSWPKRMAQIDRMPYVSREVRGATAGRKRGLRQGSPNEPLAHTIDKRASGVIAGLADRRSRDCKRAAAGARRPRPSRGCLCPESGHAPRPLSRPERCPQHGMS